MAQLASLKLKSSFVFNLEAILSADVYPISGACSCISYDAIQNQILGA
ncbi:hypothetical protein [cyanobacterium endosymbiont of Rhopalodia gibberula]|nr:hypothetical protein [cyanobacterium endosymbiont of Rhopalodia gibberula]